MKHPETHMVTEQHGPRPAGKPDECFYCRQKVGTEHKTGCVMRQRSVVLQATITYVDTVPEDWTAEDIYKHRNLSGWCANNLFDIYDHKRHCFCGNVEIEFLEEANVEDEEEWRIKSLREGDEE